MPLFSITYYMLLLLVWMARRGNYNVYTQHTPFQQMNFHKQILNDFNGFSEMVI